VVTQLGVVRQGAEVMLQTGAEGVSRADVDRTSVYTQLAQTRQTEAELGVKRALAALREALGMAPASSLDVATETLPDPAGKPVEEEVLRAALARRGEIVMADTFAQIVCLEADAQATGWRKRMDTFAVGTDIHAFGVPQEVRNNEYRPGSVPPEMPTQLVGLRSLRVQTAKSLYQRALTVVAVTRNLVALEAEDAFLRWEQSSQQARQGRQAADAGDKLAEDQRRGMVRGGKVRIDDVATAQVIAAQARGQYNEFLFRKIVALADLERITAGQFCAGLAEPAASLPAR
jgi:outer membrane protein TolC